ncbi:MAG: ribonuclease H-like domain-containing protein [Bacteroidales bacterium]|nr:ribonuclease H-like domain-containing protein [Bacteroidales bacterium]
MELNLIKPIVFFDLETTGLVIGKDHIIQIGMIKILPDKEEQTYNKLINPGVSIPKDITQLTGISDSDVASAPFFKEVAEEIKEFIGDSDLGGYNSNKFDIPLLVEEFLRCGIDFSLSGRNLVDVQNIFHKMESRTLEAAYRFYCHKELENAHSADADIRATVDVLKAQLDMYKDRDYKDAFGHISKPVRNDMQALGLFSKTNNWADLAGHIYYNDNLVPCINFGKHKGKPVSEVFEKEPSYYDWMMKSDFPLSTKQIIRQIYDIMRLKSKKF